ncbi:uncharacterized protein LOC127858978 [Dreissena polymorpha]|uniref:Uncharacterized protein n=1 Tax=Dreissena polymorpha TaxID=45954 RepID=A0A9D3YXB3_DREPO|nr:uncharacterized protein LOC127858978 [Dreissena polymorpha]XP_052252329.1 uncharacterized protein LOC127858978 [Dreissena polymorpha]KAH3709065.1 hypothetical protein DPMN_068525 [Dreissena polymorpha]
MPDLFDTARQKFENVKNFMETRDYSDKTDKTASLHDTIKAKGNNFSETVRKDPRPLSKYRGIEVAPVNDPFTKRPHSNWPIHSQPHDEPFDLSKFGSALKSVRRSLQLIDDLENKVTGR